LGGGREAFGELGRRVDDSGYMHPLGGGAAAFGLNAASCAGLEIARIHRALATIRDAYPAESGAVEMAFSSFKHDS